MNKTIIFEGLDRCLKDTLIYKIRAYLPPSHTLHYAKPPKISSSVYEYQRASFEQMFSMMVFNNYGINYPSTLILNRAHIGEFVYSPIYRDYSGEYVYDIEKSYYNDLDQVYLIVLYDSNYDAYMSRDDGESFSAGDVENVKKEIERFKEGFHRSFIHKRLLIDLNDFYIDESKIDDEAVKNKILELINTDNDLL